jgi:Tfp pilus assembly protein PilF
MKYMARALDLDPNNPEVYSTNASVLLSQCKPNEARIFLENGMDLWYHEPEEGRAVVSK